MRKLIKIATVLFVVLFIQNTFAQKSKMAMIEGKVSMKKMPNKIALYTVREGDTVLHSKVNLDAGGDFGFYFAAPYSGFYMISIDERKGIKPLYRLYLTAGKSTSIHIKEGETRKETSWINDTPPRDGVASPPLKKITLDIVEEGYTIETANDKENKKLQQWSEIMRPLTFANSYGQNVRTYKDIFPLLPEIEKQKNAFVSKLKTGNTSFDHLMKGLAEAEFEFEMYRFLFIGRYVYPTYEEYPAIYGRLSSVKHFKNTDIFKYNFGQSFLSVYADYLSVFNRTKVNGEIKKNNKTLSEICKENIENDTVKGWIFLKKDLLLAKKNDPLYREKLENYKPYILTDVQKQLLQVHLLDMKKVGDGDVAPDFSGKTPEGKVISLSNLRGKVVLVDVWATWCAPCKAQIPHLKKLEEEMKGKDVVFVSYSIDDMKDKKKWEDMVISEKLGGVQLIGEAAFSSAIAKNYQINAIPRFMVFDKEGKIVAIDAPRPSSVELKALLEKTLK
ncbi:TlpA disulfide reductase family protein [Pedobacter nyackensis]|uniref:TlpA family protein disulfide reductase n=1 Tax=Pedobacter nyackensis TaxID=475255 RepID=UPI00292E880D|nr:TlpA disulfide reductase family protein [Pedobacter nyackensis]